MNFTQKSLLSLIGKFGGAFLSLISSIFLARYLGVEGIGQYQLILSTQVMLLTILAMGYGNASIYFINSKQINKTTLVSTLLKIFLFISLFVILIFIIGLSFFQSYFGVLRFYGILFFSIGSGSLLLYSVLYPVLYVSLEVIKIQILSLLSTILFLIGILFFYHTDYFDINVVISLIGLGNLIPFLLLIFYLRHDINLKIKIDYKILKKIFFYGIKLSATNLVFLLSSNLVVFLLKSLSDNGFESIGFFSRATAISNMFILIPASIGPLIYSKWASVEKDKLIKEVEKTIRLLVFISIFSVAGIIVFGDFILITLYGREFLPAKAPLNVLSISFVFSSITIVFINFFSSIGNPTITLKIFVWSLFITGFAGFFLISYFDIIGASIAVLLGIIFNAIMLFVFAKKQLNIQISSSIIVKWSDFKFFLKALKIK